MSANSEATRSRHSVLRRLSSSLGGGKVPVAVLPVVFALASLGAASAGAGGVSLFMVLRVLRTWGRRVKKRSLDFACASPTYVRRKSSNFVNALAKADHRQSARNSLGVVFTATILLFLRRLRNARLDFSLSMNRHETELDSDVKETILVSTRPLWGRGLPQTPRPGVWKPYLLTHHSIEENLVTMRALLGLVHRKAKAMTEDQLVEGVRRMLAMRHYAVVQTSDRYWNEDQARTIAKSFAADCGFSFPLQRGGVDECVPQSFPLHVPWATPGWLDITQRISLSVLRMFFHVGPLWHSRFVETPFGRMHVLDTCLPGHTSENVNDHPPLLLQHGMFVTGWSMSPLAWLLSQKRRVVIPDLFDFEYGYSTSDQALRDGRKVRTAREHAEALSYVVRDLLASSHGRLVDIAGHSFGGLLAGLLANRCASDGPAVRKVVLLGPGGPPSWTPDPMAVCFFNCPMQTAIENKPPWLPASIVTSGLAQALGLFFSANNINTLVGADVNLGRIYEDWSTDLPTLLLWGDDDTIAVPRDPGPLASCIRSAFPNHEAFWVAGGSHNIQIDSAVAVARAMENWLDGSACPDSGGYASEYGLPGRLLSLTDRSVRRMEWSPSVVREISSVSHGGSPSVDAEFGVPAMRSAL